MTTCEHCGPRFGWTRCWPSNHSPGGQEQGTAPFRPGKTARDHRSGAWARRFANRQADPNRRRGAKVAA